MVKDKKADNQLDEAMTKEVQDLLQSKEFWEYTDQLVDNYMLVQGEAFDGTAYWAYMRVPPSKILAFKEAVDRGENNLLDYGFILAIGYDKEPPEDVRKEMEKEYPISHNFEEELKEGIIKNYDKLKLKDKYSGKKKKDDADKE